MIARQLSKKVLELFGQFPALMITGPRQSGKTTPIKSLFSELPYVSLEEPDIRQRAMDDPRSLSVQTRSACGELSGTVNLPITVR